MYFYKEQNRRYASFEKLPLPKSEPSDSGPLTWLYTRPLAESRASFAPTVPEQLLSATEDVRWLDPRRMEHCRMHLPENVQRRLLGGTLRAVNAAHPRWREIAAAPVTRGKKRVHLLALGDVGSTVLMALKLLGGDRISTIGICDVNEKALERWEFEMNQVTYPWEYDRLPPVEIVPREAVFQCDVFCFVASRGIPPVGSAVEDVRMAQFAANRELVEGFARQARQDGFRGLFAVISDPVDPLAKAALLASNCGENGKYDGLGLLPEQIQGFGLGVMNARAAYYARQEERFASFLQEGRAFGPHGKGLVIANSIEHYDDALSRELTALALGANLKMRELGFKPYAAPALSSAALSLLLTMEGAWHYSSVFLGGVYLGIKNRFTPYGVETETLPLPDALFTRLQETERELHSII